MQGLESLNKFQNFMSSVGGLGRFEDTYMIHAAEGETVVPMEVLDRNPVLKERLFDTMRDMGIQPERYIVGNEFNSINPLTGQPEFFLKWLGKRLKKGIRDIGSRLRKGAADISGYAAPIIGAMYGPAAGAAVGALLGQYKRENPGDPSQWKQMALRGGISGLGSNLATGQGIMGTGLANQYGFNPINIGKGVLGMGEMLTGPMQEGVTRPFVDTGGMNILEGLQNTFMKKGGGNLFDKFKITDILSSGGNVNEAIGSAKNKSILESIFGKDNVLQMIIKWGASKLLGDVIKEENEDAERDAAAAAADYGERTVFSQFPSLMRPGEIVASPDDALTDVYAAKGGIMDLQGGGESIGPGTGTSDSIPAMLSDGEFVMTADAVRGAGGGDRREGARKMYQMMDNLERNA